MSKSLKRVRNALITANVDPRIEETARAHIAATADATQTALLTGEATRTGETLTDLANAIIAKADAYRAAAAAIAGLRRKHEAEIVAATDIAGVDSALAGLMIDVAALAA